MATELGHITKLVEEAEPDRSPLERQLERLSRNLIWLTLVVTSAVALTGIWSGRDLLTMIAGGMVLALVEVRKVAKANSFHDRIITKIAIACALSSKRTCTMAYNMCYFLKRKA